MRVIHLINHCDFANGNVCVAVDIACEQAQRGQPVAMVSAGGGFEPLLNSAGVQHHHLVQDYGNPIGVMRAMCRLNGIMAEFKPDIVHAHMMKGAVLGWPVTRWRRVPMVTHVHNSFDAHAILMALGDRIIAVSAAEAVSLARRMPQRRIRTIVNGPLGGLRRAGAYKPIVLNRPSVGTVCGLHPRKGVADLIAAFELARQSLPEAHLYIVGEGPHEQEYRDLAARGPAAHNIHFLGKLSDPRVALASIDVFVIASHAEPFGLVVPEAREMGCAIVASRVGGLLETVEGGARGRLVAAGDVPGFARAIGDLLASPEALVSARADAMKNLDLFSVHRMCDDLDKVYRELR